MICSNVVDLAKAGFLPVAASRTGAEGKRCRKNSQIPGRENLGKAH
jgi:hypothetical protein